MQQILLTSGWHIYIPEARMILCIASIISCSATSMADAQMFCRHAPCTFPHKHAHPGPQTKPSHTWQVSMRRACTLPPACTLKCTIARSHYSVNETGVSSHCCGSNVRHLCAPSRILCVTLRKFIPGPVHTCSCTWRAFLQACNSGCNPDPKQSLPFGAAAPSLRRHHQLSANSFGTPVHAGPFLRLPARPTPPCSTSI